MRFDVVFLPTLSTAIASQIPLEHVPTCMTAAQPGYQGPGYYNILSVLSPSDVAVSLSEPVISSPVVAKTPDDSDYTQSWLFADVGNGQVIIINNATGAVLTASASDFHTYANVTPPYSSDPSGTWSIDSTTWQGFLGNPVVIYIIIILAANSLKSLVESTTTPVLDLSNGLTSPGNPVISFPLKGGGTCSGNKNQAWILQPVTQPD